MPLPSWATMYVLRAAPAAATVGTQPAVPFTADAGVAIPVIGRPAIKVGLSFEDEFKSRNFPLQSIEDITPTDQRPSFQFSMPWYAADHTAASKFGGVDILFAFFQNVAEGAATPFTKTFTIGTTNISPAVGDAVSATFVPHLLDIARVNTAASGTDQDDLIFHAVPESITFSRRNGLLTLETNVLGFGTDITGIDGSGTLPTPGWQGGTARSTFISNLYIKIGTTIRLLQDWNLTLRNGYQMFNYQRTTPQAGLLAADRFTGEGTFSWALDSAITAGLKDAYVNKTSTRIQLFGPNSTSDGTSQGDFYFDGYFIIRDLDAGGGDGQQLCGCTVQLAKTGTTTPVSIVVADAIDRIWPA